MKPESVNLYLEANGITVTGNTDQYYRLSPNGIKEWSVDIPQPSDADLIPYQAQADLDAAPTYKEPRQDAYASIGDQLDMIYWDEVNGTTTWKDHVEAVKSTYPK
jgi:hypothetical protein